MIGSAIMKGAVALYVELHAIGYHAIRGVGKFSHVVTNAHLCVEKIAQMQSTAFNVAL